MKNLYFLLLILVLFARNLSAQVITSPNPVICGSNTSAVLTASTTGTYQWSFCATEFGTYTNISGATSSSHTTTTLGFYKVAVNSVLSPAFRVNNNAYAIIKNASGTTNPININSGGSADLYVNFYGIPPFSAGFRDPGSNDKTITSNTNLKIQNVSPEFSREYSVFSVQGGCGTNIGPASFMVVNVAPSSTFTIGTVATTACSGGFIQVPTTRTGNWGASGFEILSASVYTFRSNIFKRHDEYSITFKSNSWYFL
jgi:large repetitive protein